MTYEQAFIQAARLNLVLRHIVDPREPARVVLDNGSGMCELYAGSSPEDAAVRLIARCMEALDGEG